MRQRPAYELVSANSAKTDEDLILLIADCVGDIDEIRFGLECCDSLLAPPELEKSMWVLDKATRAVKLLGGGWAQSQRQEWLDTAIDMIIQEPFSLVFKHLPGIVKKCRFSGAFVPMVIEAIEEEKAALERQRGIAKRTLALLEKVPSAHLDEKVTAAG